MHDISPLMQHARLNISSRISEKDQIDAEKWSSPEAGGCNLEEGHLLVQESPNVDGNAF